MSAKAACRPEQWTGAGGSERRDPPPPCPPEPAPPPPLSDCLRPSVSHLRPCAALWGGGGGDGAQEGPTPASLATDVRFSIRPHDPELMADVFSAASGTATRLSQRNSNQCPVLP